MGIDEKLNIIESKTYGGATFEIIEYKNLGGARGPSMAKNLYYSEKQGLKVRSMRIRLDNAEVKTEAGALYYSLGKIKSETKFGGVGGFLKKSVSSSLTDESLAKPIYSGNGYIYLEPSFKHYYMIELNNSSIIVDKSTFYCCSGSIEIGAEMVKSISSLTLGNEGAFQIKASGTGILVLELSVPIDEIVEYDLSEYGELKVDGDFSFARTADVKFTVTKSQKSLIKSSMGGEGFLNTYTGTGKVWLAPTEPIYNKF